MKKVTLFLTFICFVFLGQTQEVKINQNDADVSFYFHGDKVNGSVAGFEANFSLNLKDLSSSSIKGSVDVSTLETGIKMRDKHLYSKDYFHGEKFPKMYFESKKLEDKGDYIRVLGKLTIKETSREEEFKLKMEKDKLILTTQINTADYDVMTKRNNDKTKVDVTITIPMK